MPVKGYSHRQSTDAPEAIPGVDGWEWQRQTHGWTDNVDQPSTPRCYYLCLKLSENVKKRSLFYT